MVRRFGGRARFVVENYGDSELAKRFGVTRYPAIFVDDVLVAKPKDFGFYGKGEGADDGRYSPWRDAKSHERFRVDLTRMVEMELAGRRTELRAAVADIGREEIEPASLPRFSLPALDGSTLDSKSLAGKVTLVEFWATWCPPCRGTLGWLGELEKKYGDRLEVVALAVESDEPDVRKLVRELDLPLRWAMGSPETALKFGDLSSVPTLFLFGPDGKIEGVFYGAPTDLHARVEGALDRLLTARSPAGSR